MSYRAYVYGCLAPTAGEAEAVTVMRARVRLWNAPVELERGHQAAVQGALRRAHPPYAEAVAAEVATAIRVERKAAFALPAARAALAALDAGLQCLLSGSDD